MPALRLRNPRKGVGERGGGGPGAFRLEPSSHGVPVHDDCPHGSTNADHPVGGARDRAVSGRPGLAASRGAHGHGCYPPPALTAARGMGCAAARPSTGVIAHTNSPAPSSKMHRAVSVAQDRLGVSRTWRCRTHREGSSDSWRPGRSPEGQQARKIDGRHQLRGSAPVVCVRTIPLSLAPEGDRGGSSCRDGAPDMRASRGGSAHCPPTQRRKIIGTRTRTEICRGRE